MRLPLLYMRACFIFTLVEALPRLLISGQNILQGKSILWGSVYLVLYGMMALFAFRVFRHHHIPSAKALMTLRIGLAFSLVIHYGMTRPLPPISILMARELLPLFQLFLACKAKGEILSLAKKKSTTE